MMANKNVFRCPNYERAGTTHYWKDVRTQLVVGTVQEPSEVGGQWRCDTAFSGATFHTDEADAVAFAEIWVDRVENSRF
jgi:hypothetical protein